VLSAPGTGITSGAGDARSQAEQAYEARLAANAQQILDRVAGPGKAVVTVRADLKFDKVATTAESYNYTQGTPPISQSTTAEKYTGTAANAGGVLGSQATTATGNGNSTYDKSATTENNAVGKTVTTTEGAVGTVGRLTVSVVMDNATTAGVNQPQLQSLVSNAVGKTVTTTEGAVGTVGRLTVSVVMDNATTAGVNQPQLQSLVSNAVGLDTTRGDAITVASMAFDTTAAQQAAADLKAARAAEKTTQMWSMIKTGGIALGIVLLVLIVWLRSRRNREEYEEYEDDEPEPERIQVESVRDPAMDDRAAQLATAKREKVRGEISEMVSDRPDEVATMLRGWFADAK
jgi:flagellar M-ring protein FliF